MRKWTILVVVTVGVVLIGGGTILGLRARRDRAQLFAQFAAERQRRVEEVTSSIGKELATVAENLRAVSRTLGTAPAPDDRRQQLRAVLAVVRSYLLIEVHDPAGQRLLSVTDPAPPPRVAPAAFEAAMAETAGRAARLAPGTIVVSPPLAGDPGGWLRVFATALPRGGAGQPTGTLAVLVDIERCFAPLGKLVAGPGSHLLVLGPADHPLPLSSGAFRHPAGVADLGHASPRLGALVRALRSGQHGTVSLTEDEARRAGLGSAPLVAAYAAIHPAGGGHWAVATFSSTAAVRAHERATMLRLGSASAGLAICLVGLGGFVLFASRRAVTLRERLRHAGELAHLHEKTQKILDNIPTGVLALSEDGITVAANRALRERMPPAAVGAPLAEAFPEAPTATIHRLRALIDQSRESSRVQSLFGARLALFGEEEPYNIHVVPLEPRFPDTRFLLVIEDLSEVRALESQLLRAEKLATVGTLAAGMAHEIGTPLGIVRGRAAYVLGKLRRDHPQAPAMQVIIDQIDHVAATLRQLLDFARVKPAVVRAVSVGLVTRAVVDLLQLEAQQRKLSLHLDLADDLPDVAADPDQLQQVLVNLVMNACDASQPDDRVTIRARTEDAGEPARWRRVCIQVVDDGCGIPPEHQHQVFDPFFTTKKVGRGTGLGLAIAAQIVRNHGGQIDLASEPGRSTCVTVWWPTLPLEDHHDEAA